MITKLDLFYHVKKDLDGRNELGKRIHGKDLYHTDKYNFLQEAYEEVLDLAIYLKGEILKRRETGHRHQLVYRSTAKGKNSWHRYNVSEKGRAAVKRYQKTAKGREKMLRSSRKPERVERAKWQLRGYRKRDRIKALL